MRQFFYLMLFINGILNGQVGIGTDTPNADALLELNSSDKGLILPRLNLVSLTNFSPLTAHVAGMIVYNTANVNNVSPGLYYNNGTSWVRMTTNVPRVGDVKHGFQAADHNGWYLLNGRAITSITSTEARANATALGYVNLPNASNRFLKSQTGVETLGSTGGVGAVTLTQANLPNINFTGTTNTTGSHTHTYSDNNTPTGTAGAGTNNPIANAGEAGFVTESSGAHTHTLSIPSGGSAASVNYTPAHLVTNVFIYLGI